MGPVSRFGGGARLPHMRFHDLRHTAATLLLGSGVNSKVVSEMLGHASFAITLDIYGHVLPDMQAQAAAAMDATYSARSLAADDGIIRRRVIHLLNGSPLL
jgi:integrase